MDGVQWSLEERVFLLDKMGFLFHHENGRIIGLMAFLRCFGYQEEPRIYGAAITSDIDTIRYLPYLALSLAWYFVASHPKELGITRVPTK